MTQTSGRSALEVCAVLLQHFSRHFCFILVHSTVQSAVQYSDSQCSVQCVHSNTYGRVYILYVQYVYLQ